MRPSEKRAASVGDDQPSARHHHPATVLAPDLLDAAEPRQIVARKHLDDAGPVLDHGGAIVDVAHHPAIEDRAHHGPFHVGTRRKGRGRRDVSVGDRPGDVG